MNENNKENKTKLPAQLLKGRSLYIAIGLCLLAAGVAGRAMTNAGLGAKNTRTEITGFSRAETQTYAGLSADFPTASPTLESPLNLPPETETEAPQTKAVFDDSAKPLETTTAAPKEIRFSAPLNKGTGDDYSMGVPVLSDTMGDYRTHNGVDFKGAAGETVKTVAPGTVTKVADDRMFGNTVTVDHGNGIVSTVSGLADEGLVREGAVLAAGDALGAVGTVPVEEKEAPHIHLEIRKDGVLCDPMEVLGMAENTEE